jgi:hypothetical protein
MPRLSWFLDSRQRARYLNGNPFRRLAAKCSCLILPQRKHCGPCRGPANGLEGSFLTVAPLGLSGESETFASAGSENVYRAVSSESAQTGSNPSRAASQCGLSGMISGCQRTIDISVRGFLAL